ncbi:MAG: UvrD-helicase domain-containing protein, partial [Actinomycetota bacterium]|nr:UvrD-helicase domain-containing protein [Actinomycetota bacterium]
RRILEAHRGPDGDAIEHARAATLSLLDGLRDGGDPGPIFEAFGTVGLRGGSKKKWGEAEIGLVKQAVKTVRDIASKALKRGMVTLEVGPADDHLAGVLPVLQDAFGVARSHLSAAKRRARVLDFADLEVHALRALELEDVRGYYRERWRALLVDEFQDTNPVQAELLERLAGDGASLTVVGDEKQAIYGFRRADAAVFRRFRDRIVAEGGSEVVLVRTFRAHAGLTGTLNTVFSVVLGDLHQALEAHRADPPHAGPHLNVYAVEAEGRVSKGLRQRAEAAFISRLVKGMIDEGVLVHDRRSGNLRPVRPGDVALLSRAWEPLGVYGEALAAAGVPAVHAGGGSLLETREAKDGIALLRFLGDPRDDVALVALLRGPFFAVDDRALHGMALGREKNSSWWEAVRGSTDGDFSYAWKVLEVLMEARRLEPPSALLGLADRLTGYTAVVANLPGADRREADWRGFVDLVRELERGAGDLFSVVRSLRRLQEAEVEVPRPPLEAREAVAMMTVHAAKGMEWPVVVVPDLARVPPWNLSPVLLDPDLGVAVDLGGEDGKGVLYRVLAERKRRAEEAEARRVFYVAPTRARDHLVLTSTHDATGGVCGLALLAPGLALAGLECATVPFLPENAVPPELLIPDPDVPPALLLGPVG